MSLRTLTRSWQDIKEAFGHAISQKCSTLSHLRILHCQVILFGLHHNLYLANNLITKYFHLGDQCTACSIFDAQRERPSNTLLWNSVIRGYLKAGRTRLALDVYLEMVQWPSQQCQPDKLTFHLIVTACIAAKEFNFGSEVGRYVKKKGLQSDVLVGTSLVDMYSKTGDLGAAREVFDRITKKDEVAWGTMIAGYARAGSGYEAVSLFKDMRSVLGVLPTEGILVSLISACGHSYFLNFGKSVHSESVKFGLEASLFVSNSLLEMYISCNSLEVACQLFNSMITKDAVTLSIMVGGYVRHGYPHHALNLFKSTASNILTFPTRPLLLNVIRACAELANWEEGKLIVEYYLAKYYCGLSSDSLIITALIYMCARCGKLEIMFILLERDEVREDVVAWNAAIEALSGLNMVDIVWYLSSKMHRRGISPDHVTIISLLSAMSFTPCSRKTMETHAMIFKRGFEKDMQIANSLIDAYSKSGNIRDSVLVFSGISDKDIVSWSIMIKAYAWNSKTNDVIDSFELMRDENVKPNHITFLSLLSACSHAGLVDKGWQFFNCMKKEYGLEPQMEHFTCMVDMFCRASRLCDAYHLLESGVPMANNNAVLWSTLLSACRMHGNIIIGEKAAKHLFFLEPNNVGNYQILAEIFISAGRRVEANCVLELLASKGLEKTPGCSWLESG